MAMNGPLASAERAAERSTEILPAQPVPLWRSDGEPQRCWVIAGRLAAAMLGDHGISRVQPVFRPIAADEFFFLVWIRPDGGQMVLIEPDGRQRKHHVLPGREGLTKSLLKKWDELKDEGAESGLRSHEIVLLDLDNEIPCEPVGWWYCGLHRVNGLIVLGDLVPHAVGWEEE
jgi:hypothetical protein